MVKKTPRSNNSSLFGFLAVLYILFILLASLYPFTGWKTVSPDWFGYLFEPLDYKILRYNKLDILFNFLAYIPFGILLVLAPRKLAYWQAACLALLMGALMSISMEALQTRLPSRTSSTFDVIWNVSGTLIGVLLMGIPGFRQKLTELFLHWRDCLFESGHLIDAGISLILLWFFVQLVPEGGLFAVGDLEVFFPDQDFKLLGPDYFIRAEAIVCAANMLALGMICRCLFRTHLPRVLVFAIFAVALSVKTLGFALYFGVDEAFTWFTPGAQIGLLSGTLAFLLASFLRRQWQFALGGLSLLIGVVAVNFFPMNPYVSHAIQTWQPGNYVGLAGVTRVASVLWPFLMFFYLYFYRRLNAYKRKRV